MESFEWDSEIVNERAKPLVAFVRRLIFPRPEFESAAAGNVKISIAKLRANTHLEFPRLYTVMVFLDHGTRTIA